MSTPSRVVGFVAALAAVFGIALGVGKAVGSVAGPGSRHDSDHDSAQMPAGEDGHPHSPGAATPSAADSGPEVGLPGGLMVSQDGYTLRLGDQVAAPGRDRPVSFTIRGPDGEPITDYDVEHEKRLHLIAVRRDLSGFQHVHPELDARGTWWTSLDLTPGQWRLLADFTATDAAALTLGTDLPVPGDYRPETPQTEVRTARVDGYTVTLAGDLAPGSDAELTFSVDRDGRPVTDLEPHLGAYGHLVALREGDLAYLHVHPGGEPGDGSTQPGPDVVFYAAVPSTGGYRLYLEFKHDGVVRTAAFTVPTDDRAAPTDDPHGSREERPGHGHADH